MAIKQPPVGKAQQAVLDALNLTASDFAEANRTFDSLGLIVSSRREGRKSVPVVTILARESGALNAEGEGETWRQYPNVDLAAIEQWIA